jgi:hypothetical protein
MFQYVDNMAHCVQYLANDFDVVSWLSRHFPIQGGGG